MAMLRSTGFEVIERPEMRSIFVARQEKDQFKGYAGMEYRAATGKGRGFQ